jgi:hypothetical protein
MSVMVLRRCRLLLRCCCFDLRWVSRLIQLLCLSLYHLKGHRVLVGILDPQNFRDLLRERACQ